MRNHFDKINKTWIDVIYSQDFVNPYNQEEYSQKPA